MIVYGPDGILLGQHRRRTWELAGGTVEPGETFAEAAVREPHEEAGLVAEPDDVQVMGTLLDRVGDIVRLTVPVLITRWSGTPINAKRPSDPGGSGLLPRCPIRCSCPAPSA